VPSASDALFARQDKQEVEGVEGSSKDRVHPPNDTGAAVRNDGQALADVEKRNKNKNRRSRRDRLQGSKMTDIGGKSVALPLASSSTALPVNQPGLGSKEVVVPMQNMVGTQVTRTAKPMTAITRTAAAGTEKDANTTRPRSRPPPATKSRRPRFRRDEPQGEGAAVASRDQGHLALSNTSNSL
jgi:hypothetical protein